MRATDFLSIYKADSLLQTLAEEIRTSPSSAFRIKGLTGSLDALVFAAVYKSIKTTHVLILHDKEEAAYFSNDLQNLMGEKEILFFPMSYRRPYEYDETENANILMRAETLNQLSHAPDSQLIVTYPEALSEKVINKKSLASSTFVVKKGEKLDREFLEEFLHSCDFANLPFAEVSSTYIPLRTISPTALNFLGMK